ncbi:MAG TPA: hypothetical protein PKO15_11710 [Fibrobacteria bacterium]|nr:hypothetical protein [Fibrobacteria bacterium]HOX50032.1 hypothetical protein [Fibrobacteria bacterium]
MPWTPYVAALAASCAPPWKAKAEPSPDGNRTAVEIAFATGSHRRVFPWPVWSVQQADVDRDGCPELLLGAFKRNRFDSAARRRLQVWSVHPDGLRPRWLGTRLGGILDTFAADPQGRILARERTPQGWSLSRWRWRTFGFQSDSVIVGHAPDRPRLPPTSAKDIP